MRGEHDRGAAGRFGPGLPRISDGQLLFLLHMLARAKEPAEGGSRVAIIMNGSPLFTGDAGSGESEIRRWILENDLLEALIALPEQLFYNTGIATYVWVLTNRKRPKRRGWVQLIDATSFWVLLRKSLGAKRREVPFERKRDILRLLAGFEDGATCTVDRDGEEREAVVSRVYPTTHFGFRKITVERPLRLDFRASPERIARLDDERAFANLAVSRKKGAAAVQGRGGGPQAAGRDPGRAPRACRTSCSSIERSFEDELSRAARDAQLKLAAPIRKAILSALPERNAVAEICRDRDGRPEPDPELRDTENVPLREDVGSFFEREVKPHVPDAWIDTTRRDPQDGEVGLVGYEINFNRYFYEYRPPRPLEEIEADIQQVEKEIVAMLQEMSG